MRIISKRALRVFWGRFRDAKEPLLARYREIEKRVATATIGLQFSRPGSHAEKVSVLRSNVADLEGATRYSND